MVNVIGVRFQNAGKLYFFDPGPFWPTPGDFVVVETARGIEFGEVVTPVREMNDEQLAAPLKQVVRIATAQDVQHAQENKANEKEAYAICQKKISEHKLDMKLVSVEYTFDNSKILFYFTANGRVDFRSLVKDLAAVFKTRIELRQIGVRDEAKMLGGLGPCGRPVCCGAFLGDFQPVSIKMAKEQNLSLNPTKISGVCGRLMCCLKYEQDNYEQTRKRMPKVGKEVITPDGNGVVWDLNIIKETVRVRIQKGDSSELKDYPMDEVQRIGGPAQQPKQEAPAKVEEIPAEQDELAAEDAVIVTEEAVNTAENQSAEEKQPVRERRNHDRPRKERSHKEDGKDKQLGKPVQRENPNRKDKPEGEQPKQQPAPEPKQEKPAEPAAAKPAVSPWKQAVEAALKAAQEESK
ncbi:MAG: stage 0 sporulation protein [Clostridia bacterium]|nr:stage 0 sporulation protein [Clostridia bacterium]